MLELLWLVPILPLVGFATLAVVGARIPRGAVAVVAVGSVAASTVVAILVGISFVGSPPAGNAYSQTLWSWMHVGGLAPGITFYLDALSLVMILVVTFVGLLIHVYSTEFMVSEEGYSRFFAYMNLFVGSMLVLVLADNLLLLYLGWEGVGVCSYLLIGFWYKEAKNGRAALKAFIVTRVGDTALIIGLFLLFSSLNTLRIQPLMQQIAQYPAGSLLCTSAAILLLIGALGKSAQLPLQTWLPDAMAGPTPVSALIHAATMVTAGVYLIARTHVLFSQAPAVQMTVAVIGAVTLLLAGFSALTQSDIKRVLAYSTISQIGYMFLALGVGAWAAGIFHFMVHAFFKSLLFLAAGVVINALGKEHNIFKMGGLRTQLPLTFWVFLVGCASLSAVPLVTAGFYSKDMILWQVWSSAEGSRWLWAAGLAGAFLTSMYSFRVIFIAFFGQAKATVERAPGYLMSVPLVILAVLSIIGGWVELPDTLIANRTFTNFLHTALPPMPAMSAGVRVESILQIVAGLVSLSGILAAYWLFLKSPRYVDNMLRTSIGSRLHQLWFADWGFDWFYDKLVVQPYVWLARINKDDFIDLVYDGIAWLAAAFNRILSPTESGNVRWYAACIVIGAIIVLAFTVFS